MLRSGDGPHPRHPEVRDGVCPGGSAPTAACAERARAPRPDELRLSEELCQMCQERGGFGSLCPLNFFFFLIYFSPPFLAQCSCSHRPVVPGVKQRDKHLREHAAAFAGPRAAAGTRRAGPEPGARGSLRSAAVVAPLSQIPALAFGLRRLACPLFVCALWKGIANSRLAPYGFC